MFKSAIAFLTNPATVNVIKKGGKMIVTVSAMVVTEHIMTKAAINSVGDVIKAVNPPKAATAEAPKAEAKTK